MATAPSTISFIPPTDPGTYADAIRLQRQQQIADALLQQSQTPLAADLPSGLRVIPKLGWAGGLVKLGQALMANKLESDVTNQRAAMAQAQMGQLQGQFYGQGGQGGAQPAQSPYAGAQAAMAVPGQGQPGPTMAAAAQAPQQVQPTPPTAAAPQGGPMLIPGMDPSAAMRFYMTDPTGYMKALAESRMPTNEQKNWSAQGVDPHQLAGGTVLAGQRQGMTDTEKFNDAISRTAPGSPERAALVAAQQKANYIAPIDAKPGTPVLDPITLQPKFFAPKTADGIGLDFQNPLHPSAYALPGYAGANAGIAGAEQAAKTDNSVYSATGPGGEALTIRGAAIPGGSRAPAGPAAPGNPQPGAPAGAAPRLPGIAGPSSTDAAIQKGAGDIIASAPQQVTASRGAVTGLTQALNLVEGGIKTGAGQAKSMNALALLNNLHVPLMKGDVDGYQTLQKYLQNSLNAAAQGTSAGGSDARFESFMHGQPNAETMNPQALSSAIRYVLSQHDASIARGNFITSAYQQAKAKGDPNAALTAQQQWASVYNPDYFRLDRLPDAEQAKAINGMSRDQLLHLQQWRQNMRAFQ